MELAILAAVIVAIGAASAVSAKRVAPDERLAVYRMGNAHDVREPGWTLLIPVLDRGIRVDLRERRSEIRRQTLTSSDGQSVDISGHVRWQIHDPMMSVIHVRDIDEAVADFAAQAIREVVESSTRPELLDQPTLDATIATRIEAVLQRWGATVIAVEVRPTGASS